MPALCIPNAQGVPFLPGPPNWFDSSVAPPQFNDSTDDPRWRGASAQSLGDGTLETASFRALHGLIGSDRFLFLSWILRADPSGPNGSQLYVGFGLGDGNAAMIIRHGIPTATTTTAGTGYSTDIFLKDAASSSFDSEPTSLADPSWIAARTRMWVNFTPSTTPTIDWAIHMAVPLNTQLSPAPATHNVTLPSHSPFRMWYAAYLGLTPEFDIIEVTWPGMTSLDPLPQIGDFVEIQTNLSTSPPCSTDGISISSLNIGTRDGDGIPRPSASRIKIDTVNNPPTATFPDEQNMFFAIPDFPAGMSIADQESVRAHFRLANWGSTLGDPTTEAWFTIPGGEAVPFDAGNGECRFNWPTPADLGPGTPTNNFILAVRAYLANPTSPPPGAKHSHQCMLVELSSVGPGVTFLRNSVYRNMNFEEASTFSRDAEISLRPGSSSDQPRDVYLYEQTYNMPDFIPPQRPGERIIGAASTRRQGVAEVASFAASRDKQYDPLQLARWMPTYTVQVYHDTGRTTTIFDGQERRILKAQTSFGYFVEHEGALYGWNYSIEGATNLGNGWYKMSIPENGARSIKTTIEADENPGCRHLLVLIWYAILRLLGQ